jgi:hypothetical protein
LPFWPSGSCKFEKGKALGSEEWKEFEMDFVVADDENLAEALLS